MLEALRQPPEEGQVVVSRTAGTAAFPARFQLVGAANPCRRGCASFRACVCSPAERAHHLSRLSRPLLDRIDLHLEIPAVACAQLSSTATEESSSAIRERVMSARARQALVSGGQGRGNRRWKAFVLTPLALIATRSDGEGVVRVLQPPTLLGPLLGLPLKARARARWTKVY